MTGEVIAFDLSGFESSECLPHLRHRPPKTVGEPKWVLQQAWRIRVTDNHGKTMGARIEWRDVPFDPDAQ
jgi:hypothetical protein